MLNNETTKNYYLSNLDMMFAASKRFAKTWLTSTETKATEIFNDYEKKSYELVFQPAQKLEFIEVALKSLAKLDLKNKKVQELMNILLKNADTAKKGIDALSKEITPTITAETEAPSEPLLPEQLREEEETVLIDIPLNEEEDNSSSKDVLEQSPNMVTNTGEEEPFYPVRLVMGNNDPYQTHAIMQECPDPNATEEEQKTEQVDQAMIHFLY